MVNWLTTYTPADVSLLGEIFSSCEGAVTSLAAACYEGNADIVRALLQCVTPHTINIQCGGHYDTALHFVICYDEYSWIRNTDLNLHAACIKSTREQVNSLLYNAQCDVNRQDYTGRYSASRGMS